MLFFLFSALHVLRVDTACVDNTALKTACILCLEDREQG